MALNDEADAQLALWPGATAIGSWRSQNERSLGRPWKGHRAITGAIATTGLAKGAGASTAPKRSYELEAQ